eukprot:10389356-Heterocapsa_arctica.AAC.1
MIQVDLSTRGSTPAMSTAPSVICLVEPKGQKNIQQGWIFMISLGAMSSVSVAKSVVDSLDYL